MKIELEERVIDTNIENNAFDLRIDNDSHVIFEGLRKSLYPDPIRAIAREITANAYDSHIENGNPDEPIQIFFPNGYMVIKDFGVGISPDRMEHVFCWYGRSTKRDDNTQIGGWGIGAKSVWSYSDSFIVDTVYDGFQYTYSGFIDESLKGKMILMHSQETDLPSGTSIKIPIHDYDEYRFKTALKNSTMFWKVPPVFQGDINQPPLTPTVDTPGWSIYLNSTDGYNVLSGDIPYQDRHSGIPSRVVLKFDIGDLDVTLNRDSLRYTDKTKEAIENRLCKFQVEVQNIVSDQIDNIESFGEVLRVIASTPNSGRLDTEWDWRGNKFTYPFSFPVQGFERRRSRLNAFHTHTIRNNVSDKAFIELDKAELTSYDRQRIGYYLNQTGIKEIYLVDPGALPINAVKLTSIKILKAKSPGPKVKRVKTSIAGRRYAEKRCSQHLIDQPKITLYLTDCVNNYRSTHILGVDLVEISPKDVKHIKDKPNWIHLDTYIKENLYNVFTEGQIQEMANNQSAMIEYTYLSFLADYHKDFHFLKTDPSSKEGRKITTNLVGFLIANKKVVPKESGLRDKYGMLGLATYIDDTNRDTVRRYVDLVNS